MNTSDTANPAQVTPLKEKLLFRFAAADDAEALADIYRPYVNETFITFEYEAPDAAEFRRRIETISQRFPYIAAAVNDKIIGYAYAGVFRSRAAYSWCAETSIYLAEDFQRKGIGAKLYAVLEDLLRLQNITNLVASITYPNPQSINFHRRMGYEKAAHFTKCGYKNGVWCDMIFMEKFIGNHALPAKEVIYLPDLLKSAKKQVGDIFAKYNSAGCSIKK